MHGAGTSSPMHARQLYSGQSSSSLQVELLTQSGKRPAINALDTLMFSDDFAFGVCATIPSGTAHS
jgi:hypothetical protein